MMFLYECIFQLLFQSGVQGSESQLHCYLSNTQNLRNSQSKIILYLASS